MKKKYTAKYLYIPLEIVIREHDGKATLAYFAAISGWNVVIGPKMALYSISDQLPEGVFLIKSATPVESPQLKKLKKHGHTICSHDEEGVVTFKEFIGKDVRYGRKTLAEIDKVFFWGEEQQKVFNTAYPESKNKGVVTGSPRLEFWRDYASEVYASEVEQLKKTHGDFILIPTSFGIANNVLGADRGVQLVKGHSGKISKELNDFMVGQGEQNLVVFKEYHNFMHNILNKFTNTNFIIRPHPSEEHQPWNELANQYSNCLVIYEGAVTPWILASKAVFHFKSTTSIEAYIMGIPAITYMPPLPEYMNKYELELPLYVSQVVKSREKLINLIQDIINNKNEAKKYEMKGPLLNWVSINLNKKSAERMLEELEEVKPLVTKTISKPKQSYSEYIRYLIEFFLCYINKYSFIKSLLPKKIRRNSYRLAYGERKKKGSNIGKTKKILDVIDSKLSNDKEKIDISYLSSNLFLIKKNN